jgi:hypothetical protein
VAADGTQVDAHTGNLLAETSIRYRDWRDRVLPHLRHLHRVFSRFIPVGVWEAVYLIQGLLDQQSTARPPRSTPIRRALFLTFALFDLACDEDRYRILSAGR